MKNVYQRGREGERDCRVGIKRGVIEVRVGVYIRYLIED